MTFLLCDNEFVACPEYKAERVQNILADSVSQPSLAIRVRFVMANWLAKKSVFSDYPDDPE